MTSSGGQGCLSSLLCLKKSLSPREYEHIRSEKRAVEPQWNTMETHGKQHGATFQVAWFFLSDSCR